MARGATHDKKDGRYLSGFAERLSALLIAKHRSDYEIGRMIDEVCEGLQREDGRGRPITRYYWEEWPKSCGGPFKTFDEWSWNVLHFKAGKATALRKIYRDLSALDPCDLTIARALRIGWTKLYLILRAARTEAALIKWLDRCDEHGLSELDLRRDTLPSVPADRRRPKKADKDSAEGSEEPDGELDEAAGNAQPIPDRPPIPDPTLAAEANEDGAPPADDGNRRVKWPLVFEDRDALRIFTEGLKAVQKRYPQIGPGRAAALMATHYVGMSAQEHEGGAPVELAALIEMIEKTYGVALEVKRVQRRDDSSKREAVSREF